MEAQKIYNGNHQWYVFARDSAKPEKIIDTNQYLIKSSQEAIILDPGGVELFSPMLASILKHVDLEHVTTLFASHQDPDIISSLGLWDKTIPNAKLHAPWLWEGFIRHFGMENIEYVPIKDEGGEVRVGSATLKFVPAHYLHSSGNFNVYDPQAKILMSGDIGAAMEDHDAPLYVDNMSSHSQKMRKFHQRWMPSNEAKQDWIRRVRQLDIDLMCPQHGRLFQKQQVVEFLNWFEELPVGIAVK